MKNPIGLQESHQLRRRLHVMIALKLNITPTQFARKGCTGLGYQNGVEEGGREDERLFTSRQENLQDL